MPTIHEQRDAAGAAYAAAAEAYAAAWRELQAFDLVCANANTPGDAIPGFAAAPTIIAHREYLPDVADLNASPGERARARADQILAG